MGAPDTRTITDEIADAMTKLDTVIAEAQRMREHLLIAVDADLDGQHGELYAAQRSARIAAASLDEARGFTAHAQLCATQESSAGRAQAEG